MMTAAPTLLDFDDLYQWADSSQSIYPTATPFPHIVNTSFLHPEVLAAAIAEFPTPEELQEWRQYLIRDDKGRIAQSQKLGYSNELGLGPVIRTLLHEFNSGPFLQLLEGLTGIPDLMCDPYFLGGGLHQYLPGAVLRVHADSNQHPIWKLERRLNLLLYLNDDWQPQWGGELELWDRDMKHCVKRIPPTKNTCVIFSTTPESFHGIPDPLRCPIGTTRRSIAVYYYSNTLISHDSKAAHSTLWQARPNEQ